MRADCIMEPAKLIIVRGGGDIATGTICRLYRCGFTLLVLETAQPRAIRRTVSLAEAIYDGSQTVEGVTAERVESIQGCAAVWKKGYIPMLADPALSNIRELRPWALIDAILAKKNLGTTMRMADITIGLGPGFVAGKDVHAVIETARGHDLGRIIHNGAALPNTGIPGAVAGYTSERVLYAPTSGMLTVIHDIGRTVKKDEIIAAIDGYPVAAPFSGVVRGMIRDKSRVDRGVKIADIDPREEATAYCTTLSDKARCISGGVLEALLSFSRPDHFKPGQP